MYLCVYSWVTAWYDSFHWRRGPEHFFHHCSWISHENRGCCCCCCFVTFRNVGSQTPERVWTYSKHHPQVEEAFPCWIYHVSQLLHHTLHHLWLVLQQLRWELLVEPSLRGTERTCEHTADSLMSDYMLQDGTSDKRHHHFYLLTSAHFFQLGDELRRGHNVLLTVIMVDVAAVIRQSVRHTLSLRSKQIK